MLDQPAIFGSRTFQGSGGGGALDGATFQSADLDCSGFVIDGEAIEDSGSYIQTVGGRTAFRVPRDGKYLVTAEWRMDSSSGEMYVTSLIAGNRHCNALSPADVGEGSFLAFVHTIQVVFAAGDETIFNLSGETQGIQNSFFSITYLYAPILAPA